MSAFFRTYYAAEQLKCRHTLFSKLCYIMPALTVAAAFLLTGSYGAIDGYNWWYTSLLPGMLTIVCCMTGQADTKLEGRALTVLPVDLRRVWDAKVLVCIKAAVLGNLVLFAFVSAAQLLTESVADMEMLAEVTLRQGALAALVMIGGCIWQIPLCLWANEKFGLYPALFANLALNVAGTVTGPLGERWYINPYSVTARAMCPLIKVLPNGLVAAEGNVTYSPELMDMKAVPIGMCVCLFWLVILWTASRMWYGKKGGETV